MSPRFASEQLADHRHGAQLSIDHHFLRLHMSDPLSKLPR